MKTIEEAKKFIESNSKMDGECLIFTGAQDYQGYGMIAIDGVTHRIHRIMAHCYELLNFSDKKTLALHRNECKSKACFKREHLYAGGYSDNRQDVLESRPEAKRKYCRKGHELTPENTKIDIRGDRLCKICKKKREIKANANRKKT